MLNELTVYKGTYRTITANPLYQWDYGQILKITGIDLPETYEVHFSNQEINGETITQIGDANGVSIPDELLATGSDIWAFLYLHEGESDGETEYKIQIPVKKRPRPSDTEPTPEEQSTITQVVAALNNAVKEIKGMKVRVVTLDPDAESTSEWADGTLTLGIPKGEKGNTGETGPQGEQGISGVPESIFIDEEYCLHLIFAGGTEYVSQSIRGDQGIQGIQGEQGIPGLSGVPVSISVGSEDYALHLIFVDGTEFTSQSLRGPKGDAYILTEQDKADIYNMLLNDYPVAEEVSF